MKQAIQYKSGEICVKCGILFKDRFNEWSSTCTVNVPPAIRATGHRWNRNPIY